MILAKEAEPGSLRANSRRSRVAILAAARHAFLNNGYKMSSMELIAEEAGVTKKTVYNHFKNKYRLFAAIVADLCTGESAVSTTLRSVDVATDPPEVVLHAVAIDFLTSIFSREQIELYRTIVADTRQFPELGKLFFEGPVKHTDKVIGKYLDLLADRGAIHFSSTELATAQFTGMLKANMQMELLFGKRKRVTRKEIEELARSVVEIFLNGASPR